MCGICGIYSHGDAEPPVLANIQRMCEAMRHRGPNDTGFLDRPSVKFGHVRLSIVDLSGGHQPMSNEDGTIHVVFNGEIYNYPELREQLLARGHVLQSRCDTEVLVHLYEDKGARMVDDLNGDFAFAIWDDREKTLFLARDRLGVKPLYYCNVGGRMVFASEMKALMAAGGLPREIDLSAARTYMSNRTIPAPRTIYRNVHKLPAGHWMEVKPGSFKVQQYWDVEYQADNSRSEEYWAQEVQSLVDDAVKRQLMSDVPLGLFLSGGVDSSVIASSMIRSNGKVKTFSIGYREPRYDESRFYNKVVSHLGLEHHEFMFEPQLMNVIPSLVGYFGEPCAIGSSLPLYYLCKLASQHVTVVLGGDGNDENFAGYNDYNYVNYARWLNIATAGLISTSLGRPFRTFKPAGTSKPGSPVYRARKLAYVASLPPELRMSHLDRCRDFSMDLFAEPDQSGAEDVPEYIAAFQKASRSGDWLWPFLYADLKVLLPAEMFTKLDRMTMANGIEGRVPLVDYRLVELAARIPSRFKLKNGRVKSIFKDAFKDRLPAAVFDRAKVGFRVPLSEWFRGPLKPMAYDLLADGSFAQAGIFNPQAVQTLLNDHCSGQNNYGNVILELVIFEIWRRQLHQAFP